MHTGPLFLIALLAQAAAPPTAGTGESATSTHGQPLYGPKLAAKPAKPQYKASSEDGCAKQRPSSEREIVVCAPRTDGYRLNPDILEAKRELKGQANRPNPSPDYKGNGCSAVGPFGCTGTPAVNLIAAAIVLATMAKTAATGGNVGKMFVTDPQKTEYQLYLEAKKRRESAEKAAAAAQLASAARAAAAKAKAAANAPAKTPAATPAAGGAAGS
ncbi:MAG: hypothetical protein ABIS09_08195 [Sphingomicrobium sp.]